jgi:thymidylate synthase
VTGLIPGRFIHTFGDVHLYLNHLRQAEQQLGRTPLPFPILKINEALEDIDDVTYDDIQIVGYESHPAIKAPVAK